MSSIEKDKANWEDLKSKLVLPITAVTDTRTFKALIGDGVKTVLDLYLTDIKGLHSTPGVRKKVLI